MTIMSENTGSREGAVLFRGAQPSPRNVLAAAAPHVAAPSPAQFLLKPAQLSDWGNVGSPGVPGYGDCVTAEEAFAKACHNPEIFITRDNAIAWARKHNVLNGALLPNVLTLMTKDGFPQNAHVYDDGPDFTVDWADDPTLKSAISSSGPVKLGVAAAQLDPVWQGNGGRSGWFAHGFHPDPNEDHCTSLCGYGPNEWLASQLGGKVPAGVDKKALGYAMFTWDSIGIIDPASMRAITHEAWVRKPTTVINAAAKAEKKSLSRVE
ncbi:MAG: hypothetical protein E7812_11395 [Phenylobacterium sp.]|nr:MAG: hypothetical protein E7812_11395 [Phenylobacterium sp.]